MHLNCKSKSCLILDDNPARFTTLVEQVEQIAFPYMERIIIVTTAQRAIKELEHKSWNVISLDHDLDGQVYVASENPNTGFTVAKFIVDNNIVFNTLLIHTLNDVGARNMYKVLQESVYARRVFIKPCIDM